MDFSLERQSAFSFACRVCGRCCSGKIIMIGPHEVLGMARFLGVSTTEFLARYADNGGTTLRSEADGRCVFVTPAGCRVHPRRPLVCRLYPLGRTTDNTGVERFALFPKQPECGAEYGSDGTITGFLESQGVEPYFGWSRRYGLLYRRMMGLLDCLGIEGKIEKPAEGEGAAGAHEEAAGANADAGMAAGPADPGPLSSWQDIDASLAEYCAAKGLEVPKGIEASIDLHVQAMEEWLDGLESRLEEGAAKPGKPEGET